MLVIVNADGLLTVISEEAGDIYEYAKKIGGKVIDDSDYVAPPYVPTPQEMAQAEAVWRAETLAVIARQLEAIEEDEVDETPPDLLPGTRKQWLKYRGQVSNWNDSNPDFPDSAKRPVAPT